MKKVALIDLGTNSARLVLYNVLEEGYFYKFDEMKESVRIGRDMERDGFLKPARIQHTIKTITMFKRLIDSYHIEEENIIAVATAAVRRAKNQKSFLEEMFSATGIAFRVLERDEESKIVYHGVINSMDIMKGIILEIGGGSTKIVYYIRRNILGYETLPFGSVTLTEMFSNKGYTPKEQTEKIEEYFKKELEKIEWLKDLDPETQLIGVGGSFRNLAKIHQKLKRYPLDMVHNYHISSHDFDALYEMLRVLDLDKKQNIKGIGTGRADILPSAFAAMKAFSGYIGSEEFVVSSSGLREGIMFNLAVPQTLDKPINDVVGQAFMTKVAAYGLDVNHVNHVIDLSLQLFKQLRVLHKYPRNYLKILKVAAAMHDSGMQVKFYDHQKASIYMILTSNLYAISHRDLVVAAFVAGCHTRENIDMRTWNRFKDVVLEDDIDVVKKLGVILRIAESLDRSRAGAVKSINCDVLGDSVIMKTTIEGDGALELKDALNAIPEFKRAFGKNLEIL